MAEPIRIGLVFPQLLGTYGDRGNAEVLAWRLRRRGHRAQVVELPAPGAIPAGLDAYMLGGGEDLNQAAAVKLLLGRQGRGLRVALAGGAPALAVCGSLQLLGTTYLDGAGRRAPAASARWSPGCRTAACSPASRTTAAGRGWAARPSRSPPSCAATATTATTAPRASGRGTWSPPTCTDRCWHATRRLPTRWRRPCWSAAGTRPRWSRSTRTLARSCTTRGCGPPASGRPTVAGGAGSPDGDASAVEAGAGVRRRAGAGLGDRLVSGSSRRRRRSPGRWGCRS